MIAAAGVLGVALVLQLPLPVNHDAALQFEMSMRVVRGARFGRDIYDVNPPMAVWLMLPSAALALAIGAGQALIFKLSVFALMLAALAASWTLLRREGEGGDRAVAMLGLAAALLLLPGYDFGQREHMALALTLPYILAAAIRARGRRLTTGAAILIGVAAALGIGMKPYFLAAPALVELWLLARTRRPALWLRPEAVTMAGALTAYLAAVWFWAPDYLLSVVPDAAVAYGAYQSGWTPTLHAAAAGLWPLALGLAALILAGRRPGETAQAALVAGAGFLAAALCQRKGWSYQLYPAQAYILIAAGLLTPAVKASARLALCLATAVLAGAVVYPLAGFALGEWRPAGIRGRVGALTRLFSSQAGPGGPVFAFITSPRDVHPAVLASGARWATASGVLPFLPAALDEAARPDSRQPRVEAVARRRDIEMLSQLAAAPPAVILFDAAPVRLGIADPSFDYLAYFARYPAFTQLIAAYAEQPRIGGFRVFVRAPAAGGGRFALRSGQE